MKFRNKFVIAASVLTIAAVAGITVGATTAIFTKQATAHIHVSAGSLDVKFYLTGLSYDQVNGSTLSTKTVDMATDYSTATGYTTDIVDPSNPSGPKLKGVDLSLYGNSAFSVTNIYPTFEGTATFVVQNCNDMAIRLNLDASVTKAKDAKGSEETLEKNVFTFTSDNNPDTVLAASQGRKINLNFKLSDVDNTYMGAEFDIDVLLTATQALTHVD